MHNDRIKQRTYSRLRSLKDTDLTDPTANDFLVYDDVLDKYVLKSATELGLTTGGLTEIVQDLSPELGNQLDALNNKIVNLGTPTEDSDAATKLYVDQNIGVAVNYYFNDTPSDLGGIYYEMQNQDLGEGTSTIVQSAIGTGDDQAFVNFVTPVGGEQKTKLQEGTYRVHTHFERTSGTKDLRVYAEIYSRTSGGVETLHMTTATSDLITAQGEYDLTANLASEVTINATDRIVIKFYINASASGSNSELTFYLENDYDSSLLVPTTLQTFNNVFLRLDGAKAMEANLDMDNNNVVNVQDIVFTTDTGEITVPDGGNFYIRDSAGGQFIQFRTDINRLALGGTGTNLIEFNDNADMQNNAILNVSNVGDASAADLTKLSEITVSSSDINLVVANTSNTNTGDGVGEGTGVLTGGVLSAGAGATEYSISDGTGQIVDADGTVTLVSWSGKTNITPANLATNLITFVAIDSGGNVVESTTRFTATQSRTLIVLGVAVHVDKINVDTVNNEQHVAYNTLSQLIDLHEAIGFFNISGNVFSANGANLNIDKSAGVMSAAGANYPNDGDNPNQLTLAALSPCTFQYRFSNGDNGVTGTTIDPANLDDGAGGLTALSTNNKWSVQRIFSFTSNNVKIQRGQTEFNTKDEAIAGISSEAFVTEPSIAANGLLRGYLVLKKNATDLSNSAQAMFISAPKFQGATGGIGSVAENLQNVYDNSEPNPEILTSTTNGAVTIRRGSTADTDNVIEVQNGAGTTTFAVDGNGDVVANSVSGVIPGEGINDGTNVSATGTIASIAQGNNATATGSNGSFAQGSVAIASGQRGSFAQGQNVTAVSFEGCFVQGVNSTSNGGRGSFVQGNNSKTNAAQGSFAQGFSASAFGYRGSFAQGYRATATGQRGSFAQGDSVSATGLEGSFAQGGYYYYGVGPYNYPTIASGDYGSFAQGRDASATGSRGSFAQGLTATAIGANGSFAQGNSVSATGQDGCFVQGNISRAYGFAGSFAQGNSSTSKGSEGAFAQGQAASAMGSRGCFAQGIYTYASGDQGCFAQGGLAKAAGTYGSFAQGSNSEATGSRGSFAQGGGATAAGSNGSFAQGYGARASGGQGTFAQGVNTSATGIDGSFAQGNNALATGAYGCFSQGIFSSASGKFGSFAQGYAFATGSYGCFGQGYFTTATGNSGCFAQGNGTTASGANGCFAQGNSAKATANNTFALGQSSFANSVNAFAMGSVASATAVGAVQFGAGTNSQANTLRVGSGPRLGNTAPTQNELLTTDANNIIKSSPTIITSETVSAVNQITVTDAITTNGPDIAATGTDANIDLNLTPKGTGGVICGGTATGQSTIAAGLVVNEDGGATANDDFRVETTSQVNAFVVDASADEVLLDVVLKLPYLGAAPSGLTNGMIWMESDGLHIYYAGAEKLVAGV